MLSILAIAALAIGSVALYGSAYADDPATLVRVTSDTANGTYTAGDSIGIVAEFSAPVDVEPFAISDGSNGFDMLGGAHSVTTVKIGDGTYALVASYDDDGIQIIDITDPSNPTAAASVADSIRNYGTTHVAAAEIGGGTYALAASEFDGIRIVNITDPSNPATTAHVSNNALYGFSSIPRLYSVEIAEIGGGTYALIASLWDGVQIMNITDPSNPAYTAYVTHKNNGFFAPFISRSVATAEIGGGTYALALSSYDIGVQIINVTDPRHPTPTASIYDGECDPILQGGVAAGCSRSAASIPDEECDPARGCFAELDGAYSAATVKIGGRVYALVASYFDSGVQIIDITDPSHPTPTASVSDDVGGFDMLGGAHSVVTAEIGGRVYALVAAYSDIRFPNSPHDRALLADGTNVRITSYGDSGVQIIDITDPSRPAPAASVSSGIRGSDKSVGAYSVATAEIGGRVYALVVYGDSSIQIIDITDPYYPTDATLPFVDLATEPARRAYYDGGSGTDRLSFLYRVQPGDASDRLAYAENDPFAPNRLVDRATREEVSPVFPQVGDPGSLSSNRNIAIEEMPPEISSATVTALDTITVKFSERTYSAYTNGTGWSLSGDDASGLQVSGNTDPAGISGTLKLVLSGDLPNIPPSIDVVYSADDGDIRDVLGNRMGDSRVTAGNTVPYVERVTSSRANGTYVLGDAIDIVAEFSMPVSVEGNGVIYGSNGFERLHRPEHITTVEIGDGFYALVAAGNSGVQIINITDPGKPTATSSVVDDVGGFDLLYSPTHIVTVEIRDRLYALVTGDNYQDGVQIMDITDPGNPTAVASVPNGEGGFRSLYGAQSVTTVKIGDRFYALVASLYDRGVQIMDITDPHRPSPTASVFYKEECNPAEEACFDLLGSPTSVATVKIGGSFYALVSSSAGIQIMNITNPARPTPTATISDGECNPDDHEGKCFDKLDRARSVAIVEIDGRIYALVAANGDSGVQIIDITVPSRPDAVASVSDGAGGFDELYGAYSVETAEIGGRVYALVASYSDSGVQIIDITVPSRPVAVASVSDGAGGFNTLRDAKSATAAEIGGRVYALVAAHHDHGVQIIDITDPYFPADATIPFIDLATEPARRAYYDSGSGTERLSFLYHVQPGDASDRLAYAENDPFAPNRLVDRATREEISPMFPQMGDPGSLSSNKNIAVAAVNRPLTLDAIRDQEVDELSGLTFTATAGVAANDLTFGLGSHPPAGASIDPVTGVFTWTPAEDQDGSHTIAVTVFDGNLADSQNVMITVREINKAPVLAAIQDQEADELSRLTFTATASDEDIPANVLTFGLGGSPPAGASIHQNGTFAWTPTEDQDGSHAVTVTVSDGNLTDSKNVAITVRDVNKAPVLAAIQDQEVNKLSRLTFTATASDEDIPANVLTFGLGGSPPAGASIDPVTGVFTWTPAGDQDGSHTVTVTVSDGNLTDSQNVTIVVSGAETYPTTVASIVDGNSTALGGASGVATFETGSGTYAAVTSYLESGVQIIDVTVPYRPAAIAAITDGNSTALGGATGVATFETGSGTYAIVASRDDSAVQIIDVTVPSAPTAIAAIADSSTTALGGATGVATFETGSGTYAIVASRDDSAVQIIDVTVPSAPTAIAAIADSSTTALGGATGVATFETGSGTYAIVASLYDSAVQIIDVTVPSAPTAIAAVEDSSTTALGGATGVATFETGSGTYAAVASYLENSVQIINVTVPSAPAAIAAVEDSSTTALGGAFQVATFETGSGTYAIVTSYADSAVQIIDVTVPSAPAAIAAVEDSSTTALGGVTGVATFETGSRAYAIVASFSDNGVQIIKLGPRGTDSSEVIDPGSEGADTIAVPIGPSLVPEAPRNLTAVAGEGELALSWEAPASDGGSPIEGYKVQWESGTEDGSVTKTRQALSHVITGLTNNAYTVRVLAYNQNGDGAASAEVSATPRPVQRTEPTPSVTIGLSPSGPVEPNTAITVTMSFASLEFDSDVSDIDYVFRADVRNADSCEGGGIGFDRYMYKVDENPEVRAGTISADCPAGKYTLETSILSPGDIELASAAVDFTVTTPEQQRQILSTDAALSGLALSGVDFGAFDPATTAYTASVANGVTQTTVTPATSDGGATYAIKLGGVADADGTIPLAVGGNVVTIEVTSEDGNTVRIYAVTVTRAASTVLGPAAAVELSPSGPVTEGTEITVTMNFAGLEFDSDASDTDYTFRADVRGANSCEGGGMGNDRYMYKVDKNPETRAGSVSASCAPGDYTVEVSISSARNAGSASATADFTITAPVQQRPLSTPVQQPPPSTDATLSGLALSGVNFGAFDPATTAYTASVANGVTQTTVTPATSDGGATYAIKLGGVADADGTIPLAVGGNVITIEVTAEDGNTAKIYTVTVTRAAPSSTDAALSGLALSGVDFGAFDPATTAYTASVANGVTQTADADGTTTAGRPTQSLAGRRGHNSVHGQRRQRRATGDQRRRGHLHRHYTTRRGQQRHHHRGDRRGRKHRQDLYRNRHPRRAVLHRRRAERTGAERGGLWRV